MLKASCAATCMYAHTLSPHSLQDGRGGGFGGVGVCSCAWSHKGLVVQALDGASTFPPCIIASSFVVTPGEV